MKTFILFFNIFCLLFIKVHAQNLIPDPTFGLNSSSYCGIMQGGVFTATSNNWSSAGGTPDLFFTDNDPTCYNHQPISLYGGVIGIKGSETPRTGKSFAGFFAYTINGLNQREYIQTQLSSPMVIGQTYLVQFYVSLADSTEKYTNKIGAYLSTTAVSTTSGALNYTPQIQATSFVSNHIGWTKIEATIVATQAYTHITIGNFYDDNSTPTQINPTASGGVSTYGAYYYIDDVTVQNTSTITSMQEVNQEAVAVYPSPVKKLLNIKIPEELTGAHLSILNMLGQQIQNTTLLEKNSQLDWSTFPQGTYFIQIKRGNQMISKKIIKE